MNVKIPDLNSKLLVKLETIINSEFEPIEIVCEIENDQKELDCYNIIQAKVTQYGGKMILGWQIWETEILMEAEAHAVWEDENENLHDISPKSFGLSCDKIIFIEDPRLKYEGKQIQNIRLNITKNSVVDDFIKASTLFFYLQNKGQRADCYDLTEILSEEEIQEIANAYKWKDNLQQFITLGNNEKSLCYCGSPKIYANCHRKQLEQEVKRKYKN